MTIQFRNGLSRSLATVPGSRGALVDSQFIANADRLVNGLTCSGRSSSAAAMARLRAMTGEGSSALVAGQLAGGTLYLSIDVAGLDFADTAAIRIFVLTGQTLRQRGGSLVLLRPQRALVRTLEILGVDEVLTIRPGREAAPEA